MVTACVSAGDGAPSGLEVPRPQAQPPPPASASVLSAVNMQVLLARLACPGERGRRARVDRARSRASPGSPR